MKNFALLISFLVLFGIYQNPAYAEAEETRATAPSEKLSLPPSGWNLIMGNPSKATNPAQNKKLPEDVRNNYLLDHTYFQTSYNDKEGIPNWVSWHLSSDYIGTYPRAAKFAMDKTLLETAGFHPVHHEDYTGSGFDRGHMTAHDDRARAKEMSDGTFICTNILPQSPANNRGAWEALERYGRILASKPNNKDLFIVAGGLGEGGEGETADHKRTGVKTTIGARAERQIRVPAFTYKIIMVTDKNDNPNADPKNPLTWISEKTRLIAVKMPNNMTVPETAWGTAPTDYRISVAELEKETGYTFFSEAMAFSPENRKILEAKKLVKDKVVIPHQDPTIHGPHPDGPHPSPAPRTAPLRPHNPTPAGTHSTDGGTTPTPKR